MKTIWVFILIIKLGTAFECFTCNVEVDGDDTQNCIDEKEDCPSNSCTMAMYTSKLDNRVHMRKFCTSPGTPLFEALVSFPGGALCRNLNPITGTPEPFPNLPIPPPSFTPVNDSLIRAKRVESAAPPAPPSDQTATVVCVCTSNLCNGGTFDQVMKTAKENDVSFKFVQSSMTEKKKQPTNRLLDQHFH